MPITDLLRRNAQEYGDKVCLTEINPEEEMNGLSWKEFSLVETAHKGVYRKELTWRGFDEQANRFANLLLSRGVKRGDKIGILLMNCIEWLPIYFGILKTGAIAVPLNFRYSSDEIKYALDKADVITLVFGPEFIERVVTIKKDIGNVKMFFYVNGKKEIPSFAEYYHELAAASPSRTTSFRLTRTTRPLCSSCRKAAWMIVRLTPNLSARLRMVRRRAPGASWRSRMSLVMDCTTKSVLVSWAMGSAVCIRGLCRFALRASENPVFGLRGWQKREPKAQRRIFEVV